MNYFPPTKMPNLIQRIGDGLVWKIPSTTPDLYLTFDDGPTPEVTPWVLDILKKFNAKATFFCIGKNVVDYPNIYNRILEEGHTVGNHTQNHIKGWNTSPKAYLNNIRKGEEYISSKLFRPPYGQLRPSQIKLLQPNYNIIMWSILSKDYNIKITPEQCANNVVNHANAGDIVVFHDSKKAEKNMKTALEQTLIHFSKLGYSFKCIPESLR